MPCRPAGVLLRLGSLQPVLLSLPLLPQLHQRAHHVRADAAGRHRALLRPAGARTAEPAAEGQSWLFSALLLDVTGQCCESKVVKLVSRMACEPGECKAAKLVYRIVNSWEMFENWPLMCVRLLNTILLVFRIISVIADH